MRLTSNSTDALRGNVEESLHEGDVACCEHSRSNARIEVSSGHMAYGLGHGGHRQAESERDSNDSCLRINSFRTVARAARDEHWQFFFARNKEKRKHNVSVKWNEMKRISKNRQRNLAWFHQIAYIHCPCVEKREKIFCESYIVFASRQNDKRRKAEPTAKRRKRRSRFWTYQLWIVHACASLFSAKSFCCIHSFSVAQNVAGGGGGIFSVEG